MNYSYFRRSEDLKFLSEEIGVGGLLHGAVKRPEYFT
jgi:hypothetical protein